MARRLLQLEGKEVGKPELNTLLKQLDDRLHKVEMTPVITSSFGGTITAADVINVPTGTTSSTNVQAAINEIASDVASIVPGVSDHGALTGLSDNDHPQYVLTVEPGTGTLSAALAAASTGTVFTLKAGTYTETTLDVPNALTEFSIIGQGPGVTFISITGTGIGINASDVRRNKVVLRGFTLLATTNAPTWAISIWGRSQNSYVNNMILLKDISIERTSASAYFSSGGVRLENCFEARLENVHVRNKPSDKVGVGFQLESSVVCNLISCTATETATAFKIIRHADWTRVENALSGGDAANQAYHGTEGCRFFGCESYICTVGWSVGTRSLDNIFSNGTLALCSDQAVEDNGATILGLEGFNSFLGNWTDGCTTAGSVAMYLKMQGWKICDNTLNGTAATTSNYGVYAQNDSFTYGIISNNLFRFFDKGVVLNGPDYNVITGNIFQDTTDANSSVYVYAGSNYNTVTNNQYTDAPGYTDGGTGNIWIPSDPLKANLASPTFTGTPAAPTAAVGTSTTQLATTAFVDAEAVAKAGDTMTGILYAPPVAGRWSAGTGSAITLTGALASVALFDANIFNIASSKLTLQTVASVSNAAVKLVEAGTYRISVNLAQNIGNNAGATVYMQRYNSGDTLQEYTWLMAQTNVTGATRDFNYSGTALTNASANDYIIVTYSGTIGADDNWNILCIERLN